MKLKPLLAQLLPLHRTLASEGMDEALHIVGEHMPAISNYQNLASFANNPLAAGTAYQTLVQPIQQIEQTRVEQISQNQRIGKLQSNVQGIESRRSGMLSDGTIRPTGHSATYLNFSHFYFGLR